MNKNLLTLMTTGALLALGTSSCSVCSHTSVADMGRSAEAILLPLQQPTLYKVDKQWYMLGHKTTVERSNAPWVRPEQLYADKRHPERYSIDSDEMTPMYSPIPTELATSLQNGRYTHSDAISFINRKWVDALPADNAKEVKLSVSAPDYFRNMSSHRLIQTEQGSFLLANIGEMTADFSAVLAYPLAALSAIVIDMPASFLYSPPVKKKQIAQPEVME